MQRPPSIVMFERLYLASFVLWVINTIAFWNVSMAAIDTQAGMAGNPVAPMMPTLMLGSVIVTAVVTLLLWFFAARRASVVAKWFVVVTEAIGALSALFALFNLVRGASANPVMTVIGIVTTGLAVAAALMLFKPDANAWFAEDELEADATVI